MTERRLEALGSQGELTTLESQESPLPNQIATNQEESKANEKPVKITKILVPGCKFTVDSKIQA